MTEDLKLVASQYIHSWRNMSRVYAGISIVLRGSLIIGSALVAAKLGTGTKLLCDQAVTFFSVYVAAGTAIEAWLKPREKWKGFMTDCENMEDLHMRLENWSGTDPKELEEFRLEFQRLLATHREKNVF